MDGGDGGGGGGVGGVVGVVGVVGANCPDPMVTLYASLFFLQPWLQIEKEINFLNSQLQNLEQGRRRKYSLIGLF